MSISINDSPIKKVMKKRGLKKEIDYSPYIYSDYSPSTYNEIAPVTSINRSNINKASLDYSPAVSNSFYSDYEPSNKFSTTYRVKYSPYTDYQTYNRYAPYSSFKEDYEPVLVSRFKPQPIIITNSDMIANYFNYIINLLRVLR